MIEKTILKEMLRPRRGQNELKHCKERKAEVKEGRQNSKLPDYKILSVVVAVMLLLFFCFLVPVLNWLNGKLISGEWTCQWFVLNSGVTDWFAFWGSFSGTIVSALIGLVTLRLTQKIEKNHIENSALENKLTIVRNMPSMICKSVDLYSFGRGDVLRGNYLGFNEKNNYEFVVKLDKAFPPYFEIAITEMELKLLTDKSNQTSAVHVLEKMKDYRFSNQENFLLYINVPSDLDDLANHFYILKAQTTLATPYERRNVQMRLKFECKNALLPETQESIDFNMILTLENKGREKDHFQFLANNIQFTEI